MQDRGYSRRVEVYVTGRGEMIVSHYDTLVKTSYREKEALAFLKGFQSLPGCQSSHNGYFIR